MIVKIEEPKPEFKPITIVIETKEEAYSLWHRLNVPYPKVAEYGYASDNLNPTNTNILSKLQQIMFEDFSKVYKPKKGE